MSTATYPSPIRFHRNADIAVHAVGLGLILVAGGALLLRALGQLDLSLILAVLVYLIGALASNLASWAYHFSPCHNARTGLRRVDHAAIYLSVTGTFTPFFVLEGTGWSIFLLCLCWGLSLIAIWKKITDKAVKSRWSTASYLGLGALGLSALPGLAETSPATLWCVFAGALCYVIGTGFYVRKSMPFRYSIWHAWANLGGIFMFAGIWIALF